MAARLIAAVSLSEWTAEDDYFPDFEEEQGSRIN
jgi:hypothetical protein